MVSADYTLTHDFMRGHYKHTILHQNKNRTSFLVEDMATRKHYVLKEILITSQTHRLPHTNERDVLKHLFTDSSSRSQETNRTGIIPIPDIFFEPVRLSLVYPFYQMDLFTCITTNIEVSQEEGMCRSRSRCKPFLILFSLLSRFPRLSGGNHRNLLGSTSRDSQDFEGKEGCSPRHQTRKHLPTGEWQLGSSGL